MDHALAERHFDSYEDVRKWLYEWFASKNEEFFWYTQIAWKMGKMYNERASTLNKFVVAS